MELLTISGFNAQFEQHLPRCATHLEAYHATEREVISRCGRAKYANFDSFKQARLRWLRSNFCRQKA